MNFIHVIHLMCRNYLIDLITHSRHRNRNSNNRNNSIHCNDKGAHARSARAPLLFPSPLSCQLAMAMGHSETRTGYQFQDAKKNRGGPFFNILGKPLGKLGQFSQGLDPGPAQGLTWASPGLDPGQPRSIFWSRFWSNRTTETTAGTETTKGRARFARAPLCCCSECCCFCCSV